MSDVQIISTSSFRRSQKRYKKKHYDMSKLKRAIKSIIDEDKVSLRIYRDHAISGNYKGFRELHVESDLLLIYYFSNNRLELLLLDTGSHDELSKWFY